MENEIRKKFAVAALLFIFTFLVYFLSNPTPLDWYNHYVHLAYSFLAGRVDVSTLPGYYQDTVKVGSLTYLPFPPIPAVVLMPAVAIWGLNTSQPLFAMFFGALNAMLVFLLVKKLDKSTPFSIFISLFFAFGTVHWYASAIGTTWFFAHIISVLFFLLSMLFYFQKNPFISGASIALSVLSRLPVIFGAIPLLNLRNYKTSLMFLLPLFLSAGFLMLYNYLRFGNIFETGYLQVYSSYVNQGNIYRSSLFNFLPSFGYLDFKNIPLHLFTLFAMLPEKINEFPFYKPSPYGLSILFTSPLFIFALRAPFKERFVKSAWVGILLIALVDFSHYSQGWVQFGYRFALDFIPLLLVLTALGIKKINWFHITLLIWSILINFWGVWWGVKLGW